MNHLVLAFYEWSEIECGAYPHPQTPLPSIFLCFFRLAEGQWNHGDEPSSVCVEGESNSYKNAHLDM